MAIFLANRGNLQSRRLHDRLKNRLQSEDPYSKARLERASPRDPGPFRVVAETDPRELLERPGYPTSRARLEVGFDLFTTDDHEYYWFNWVEPDREMLVGWHRDDTHSDLGAVHLQVNDGDAPVVHESAELIDSHPLDVFSRRLATLPAVVEAVEWDGDRPTGLRW